MNDSVTQIQKDLVECISGLKPGTFVRIPTSRNLSAIVDRSCAEEVLKHRWYAIVAGGAHIYAVADVDGRRISLQRFVLGLVTNGKTVEDIKQVSFANKVSFDCRLSNLVNRVGRTAVMRNRLPKRNTSSVYKGVMRKLRMDGSVFWRGQIKGDIGTISLGSYDNEEEAARVYDAAAFLLFEGAGYYNFPETCPDSKYVAIAEGYIQRFKRRKIKRSGLAI